MEKKKIKGKKTRQINIRLTNEEFESIKEKAENYPSMSLFIIDAIKEFDNRSGVMKINSLNKWSEEFMLFRSDISQIGNNINQLAHYFNTLNLHDIPISESSVAAAVDILSEWTTLFKKMVRLQEDYTREVVNI